MHLVTQQYRSAVTPYLIDHKNITRPRAIQMLAVTKRGTGRILTISREGLSFGCLYPHIFPQEWKIDILDGWGGHIRRLKVRKIWEMNGYYVDCAEKFDLVIGAEFIDLSDQQTVELAALLEHSTLPAPAYEI